MATDAAGLVVALIAQVVTRRPPSRRASYGYARAEVLAAFINALAMLALVVWIAVEAVARLLVPTPVAGQSVMAVAVAGLAVNGVVAWLLSRADRDADGTYRVIDSKATPGRPVGRIGFAGTRSDDPNDNTTDACYVELGGDPNQRVYFRLDGDGNGLPFWCIEGDVTCRSGESGMDNSSRFDAATRRRRSISPAS